MSSTIENIQKILEARVNAAEDLAVATPFTAMYTRQTPLVDMGAEEVTVEMFKGNRKAAPLVPRRINGIDQDAAVIRPGQAGANDYLYALVSQDLEVPASILNRRIPGESMFVRGTEDQIKMMRRQWHMVNTAIDAARRVLTRDEILANSMFFNSEMPIGDLFQGEKKIVFPRSSTLKNRTVSTSWATAASATPWKDLGDAQREIKLQSQIDGRNTWAAFMSSATMENLKAIYRSQRAGDQGPNVEFFEFGFNPEQGVPEQFNFLIENGMEYNGWLRTTYSTSRVHLFTLPEGYDSTADDSGVNYVDWITGETVALTLFAPSYFKSFFGPGKLEPPVNNVVERAVGRVGIPQLGNLSGLTIGASGIPAASMMLNIYELGRNQGFGATLEHAPLFGNIRPDVTATIATETV